MKLYAWRVRNLRKHIEANRCDVPPGITHYWKLDYVPDTTSWGSLEIYVCNKCGTWRYP